MVSTVQEPPKTGCVGEGRGSRAKRAGAYKKKRKREKRKENNAAAWGLPFHGPWQTRPSVNFNRDTSSPPMYAQFFFGKLKFVRGTFSATPHGLMVLDLLLSSFTLPSSSSSTQAPRTGIPPRP